MSENITITVYTQPKLRLAGIAYICAWIVGVIGIGVWCESAAMQWAGFILLMLIAIVSMAAKYAPTEPMSIEAARRLLDEIERRGRR